MIYKYIYMLYRIYFLARWRNRWNESCNNVMDLQVLQQFLEEKV